MAREIQAQSNRSQGGKAVMSQLGNAVFWLILAIAVPVEELFRGIPEVAPYAHWAPILFYLLALWSFLRAIRSLQRLAAGRMWTPRIRVAGGSPPAQATGDKRANGAPSAPLQPAGSKRAKGALTVAVTRPPTVQRMR